VFSYLSTVYMSISFTNCTFMYTQKWKSSSVKSVCLWNLATYPCSSIWKLPI